MNTNKAAYWIAVGALALGLNSEYRHGNLVALHRIANRAGSALCRITARAEKTLAVAKFLASPEVGLPETLVASAGEAIRVRSGTDMLREQAPEEAPVLRHGIREQLRDEIRARADVFRARAEMRRAEMEIQLQTPSLIANLSTSDIRGFCPKTGTWIARTTIAHLAEAAGSPDIQVGDTFQDWR